MRTSEVISRKLMFELQKRNKIHKKIADTWLILLDIVCLLAGRFVEGVQCRCACKVEVVATANAIDI